MFDRKNDVARNKKRADAIVYAGAADEVVLTQSDFESEAQGTVDSSEESAELENSVSEEGFAGNF